MATVGATLVLIFFVNLISAELHKDSGFSGQEKQKLLDLHNYFRWKVASGKEPGQPTAANMVAMSWDDDLAARAQLWAGKCIADHDADQDRVVEPYSHVGQNMAGRAGVREAVKSWYDEVSKDSFVYDGHKCKGVCGHYTQVVWWNSWKVGCGQKQCPRAPGDANIFCNYALGGNVIKVGGGYEELYASGTPCSNCPDGFGFCMSGALCASYKQCSSQTSSCKCSFKSCQNGGIFDAQRCSCQCPKEFTGLKCDVPCKDTNEHCDLIKDGCLWNSPYFATTTKKCLKTCNACEPMSKIPATSADNLVTSVTDLTEDLKCENHATDRACEQQPYVCTQMIDWAKANCARYCSLCSSQTTKPTGASGDGKDKGPGEGTKPREPTTSAAPSSAGTRTCEYCLFVIIISVLCRSFSL